MNTEDFCTKLQRSSAVYVRPNACVASPTIVALGASTGDPRALEQILPLFPRDLHVPILIVQHMPPGFTRAFAQRLDFLSSVAVREAIHGESIDPRVVYIAPAGVHMTVQRRLGSRAFIRLDHNRGSHLHVPSVDTLMKSVAEAFHELAMGVILTGMGADGAEGMSAIHRHGGFTIGQDEASCIVYGMPRVSAENGSLLRVVPLSRISAEILKATQYRKRA